MVKLLTLLVLVPATCFVQSFSPSIPTLSLSSQHKHLHFCERHEPLAAFVTMPSSDEEFEPDKKKAKVKDGSEDDDSATDEKVGVKHNESGEAYFELGKSKRLTVRQWKKAVLIDIREYYEKDSKQLPGKKGISLTVDQYKELKARILDGSLDEQVKKLEK